MTTRSTITILVLINLALQLFDGVATYVGWQQHGEMNPLLRVGFALWGVGPTLAAAKAVAIAFLFFLARAPRQSVAAAGLALTMCAYLAFSLVPWAMRLL